jgi:hypothetical protein
VDDEDNVTSPVVSFEYEADARVLRSSQVVEHPNSLRSKSIQTLELYPLDTEINVHYDPADPQKARIDLR